MFRIFKISKVQHQKQNSIVYVISSIKIKVLHQQKRYESLCTAYESYRRSARSHRTRRYLGLESLGIICRICLKCSKWSFLKQTHFISIVKCQFKVLPVHLFVQKGGIFASRVWWLQFRGRQGIFLYQTLLLLFRFANLIF